MGTLVGIDTGVSTVLRQEGDGIASGTPSWGWLGRDHGGQVGGKGLLEGTFVQGDRA